jgi:hypothetical protein
MSDHAPTVIRPECGTHRGCSQHSKHHEKFCEKCLAFRREYTRPRRAKRFRYHDVSCVECGNSFQCRKTNGLQRKYCSPKCKRAGDNRHAKTDRRTLRNKLKSLNVTLEAWDALVASQRGRCLICGEEPSVRTVLYVDHCHETQTFRGAICANCNSAIGMVRDNPAILLRMFTYLWIHRKKVGQYSCGVSLFADPDPLDPLS